MAGLEYTTRVYPLDGEGAMAELDQAMATMTNMGWRVRFISELRPLLADGTLGMSWAIMWERAAGARW